MAGSSDWIVSFRRCEKLMAVSTATCVPCARERECSALPWTRFHSTGFRLRASGSGGFRPRAPALPGAPEAWSPQSEACCQNLVVNDTRAAMGEPGVMFVLLCAFG